VQCVGSGQVRRFAGLASLFEFLSADTAGGDPPYEEERDRREPPEKGDAYAP
jgi:hypothetical protein